MQESHPCPVCNNYIFHGLNSGEGCMCCGWEDGDYQTRFPDEEEVCNTMSLNQAKKAYKEGRLDLIRHHRYYVSPEEDTTNDPVMVAYRKMRLDDEWFVKQNTKENIFRDDSRETVVRAMKKLAQLRVDSTDSSFTERADRILTEFGMR